MIRIIEHVRRLLLLMNHKITFRRTDWAGECMLRSMELLQQIVECKNESNEISKTILRKSVHFAISKPCELKQKKDKLKNFEEERNEVIQTVIDKSSNDSEIKSWLAIHFQLRSFISQLASKTEESQSLKTKALEIDPSTAPISVNNLRNIDYLVRRGIKLLNSLTTNKQAINTSINATHATTAITVASALFMVTGYFELGCVY